MWNRMDSVADFGVVPEHCKHSTDPRDFGLLTALAWLLLIFPISARLLSRIKVELEKISPPLPSRSNAPSTCVCDLVGRLALRTATFGTKMHAPHPILWSFSLTSLDSPRSSPRQVCAKSPETKASAKAAAPSEIRTVSPSTPCAAARRPTSTKPASPQSVAIALIGHVSTDIHSIYLNVGEQAMRNAAGKLSAL